MSPEQLAQVLSVIRELSTHPYSITGASDWAAFAWMAGICQALLFGTLGIMWKDLRDSMNAGESRWQKAVESHEKELDDKCALTLASIKEVDARHTKNNDEIWQAMKDCQNDCCPRGK